MPKLSRSALYSSTRQSFALMALMLGTVSLNLLASPEYRRLDVLEESEVDEVLISWIGEEGKMYGIEVDEEILPVFELGEGLEINYALKLEDPNGEIVIFEVGSNELVGEASGGARQQSSEYKTTNSVFLAPHNVSGVDNPSNAQSSNGSAGTEQGVSTPQPAANPSITINPVETWEVK